VITWVRRHRASVALLTLLLVAGFGWTIKLVTLHRSVEAYATYWREPQGAGGGLLYVALGDSVAQGIGASSPQKGYVGLLAQRLQDTTSHQVQVVNLSRSGARIRDVLDRQLPALAALGRRPDVVTVAIGGNDVRTYDAGSFTSEVEQLTALLPAGTYVADVPYFMHGSAERNALQAAHLLESSAGRRGLRPVPLHDALQAQGRRAMLTQFAADWFHPNDRGHRVWADAFWSEIMKDLGRLTRGPDGPGAQLGHAVH
jgi:lysophospholipase L1-like esterase